MATKSKNDYTFILSMLALLLGAISLGYCASLITNWIGNSMEWSSRPIAFFTRMMKGSV